MSIPVRDSTWSVDGVGLLIKQCVETALPVDVQARMFWTAARDGDHGGSSWHYGNLFYAGSRGAALDLAAPMTDAGQRDMQAASRVLIQYSAHFVEFIHSTPFADDNGFYVKFGQFVSAAFYDEPGAHLTHIHIAMTQAQCQAMLARLSSGPPSAPAPASAASSSGEGRVWGWDASNHDWSRGPMDLASARAAGVSFFVHKATGAGAREGGRFTDPYLAQALTRARDAGIPVLGAYHVVAPASQASVTSQVDQFLSAVSAAAPWWREVPWIWQADCEDWGTGCWPSVGDARAFLDLVRARTRHGLTVGYLPRHHYGPSPDVGHDIWNASYHTSGHSLADLYPGDGDTDWAPYVGSGRSPLVLQFASDAHIGSQPSCDANAVKLSEQQLIEKCGGVEVAFLDDVNAAALAWRVEALTHGRATVIDGPTKGEKITLPTQPVAITDAQAATIATTVADAIKPQVDALRGEVVSLRARLAAAEQAQADSLKAA